MSNQRQHMDFIVVRFGHRYGYLSTGKDGSYDFSDNAGDIFEAMEKKDPDYTYAKPEELALNDHQREWTQKDRIYYNKLKHLKTKFDIDYSRVLMPVYGRDGR